MTTTEQQLDLFQLEAGRGFLQHALDYGLPVGPAAQYWQTSERFRRDTQRAYGIHHVATLDATELVRRAERTLGLLIRDAQRRGELTSREHPEAGPRRDYVMTDGRVVHVPDRPRERRSPREALGVVALSTMTDLYSLVDNVSDELFEEALAACRAEGVLSRANVLRKIRSIPLRGAGRPEVLRKTRRFDSETVVRKTVEAAAGVVTQSLLDEVDYGDLDTSDLEEWTSSLAASITDLRRLKNQLEKELFRRDE